MKTRLMKFLSVVLAVVLVICVSPVSVFAADEASGEFGNGFFWSLSQGKLVVSGNGEMDFSNTDGKAPWNNYKTQITELLIENGVTSIADSAFKSCDYLQNVSLPETLTYIADSAFSSCDNLPSITIPDGVTHIGDNAFRECRALDSIELSDALEYLGSSAFEYCITLKSVVIPDGVTIINDNTFKNCTSLEFADLGKNVSTIGIWAFLQCTSLKDIKGEENVSFFDFNSFIECSSLESIDFGEDIDIETLMSPFEGCNSLKNIYLPANFVGDGTFDFSSDFKSKDSVWEETGFLDCSSIESYTVHPDNPYYSSDEFGALYNKDKTVLIHYPPASSVTTSYTVADTVTLIEEYCFRGNKYLEEINLPDGLKSVEQYAFNSLQSLKTLEIPDSVDPKFSIGFAGCTALESVVFPEEGIEELSVDFSGCTSLKSVTFPQKTVLSASFNGCTALEDVYIPHGTQRIKANAFYGCTALRNVTLTNSVLEIGENAFMHCENLTVYFYGTLGDWAGIDINGSFALFHADVQCLGYIDGCNHSYNKEMVGDICVEDGYWLYTCVLCGDTYTEEVEKLGHLLGEWIVETEPTIQQKGVKRRYCSRCDYSESASIPELVVPCFTIDDDRANPGETLEVPVWLDFNTGLVSAHIIINYDTDIFTLTEVRKGELLPDGILVAGNDLNAVPYNVLVYDPVAEENCTEDGELFTLVFKVSEDAPTGKTQIEIDYYQDSTFDKDLENVLCETQNGEINIRPKLLPGDANSDREVNLKDVIYIERYLAGGYDVTLNMENADVNDDGKVDLKDAALIKRYLADWDVVLI